MKYRIVSGGQHGRFEDGVPVTYRRGDEIELTDDEAAGASLAGRIEPVPGPPKPKAKRKAKAKAKKGASK